MSALKSVMVLGSTGHQGAAVIKYLNGRVPNIQAVTRDPSSPKAQELAKDPGITVIQGDAANPDELFKHKPDGLFLMLPSSEDEVQLTNAVADAAAAAGVKYIVYSGVDDSGCHGAGIDRFENKLRVWDHIKTLPMKSSYLGPAGFLETLFWPTFPEGTQAWHPAYVHKYIATADIGHVAADFLADPERYAGRELMLAGDAVTAADVKNVWEETVGTELKPVEATQPFVQEMLDKLAKHPFVADPVACRREFPYIMDLKTWLERVYVPAMPK